MADDFKVVFELDVQDAISSANRLSQTLGTTVAAINSLDKASGDVQNLSLSFSKVASSADVAAQAQERAAASIRGYQSNIAKIQKNDAWREEVKEIGEVQAATNRLERAQNDLVAAKKQVASVQGLQPTQQVAAYRELSGATSEASRAQANFDRAVDVSANTSLPTLRYALYDVSNTLFMAGAAFGALSIAAVGAAISWERSFANVIRTTGVTGDMVGELRDGLAGLTREIPQSFGEVTEIAALGGQLGIAADGIVDFTRVVAMLTTTTDLSAEAAGTALGRFSALMDVAPSEFEALASAILRTGINSVATETDIVNIATQISSMGDFAGLSAHEVVGLSAALASVGAQPELSRGTITRVFTQMSRAIADGGTRLEEFARLSGVTGAEFAKSFGTDKFGGQFQTFLANISKEGGDAVQVLNDLGITSVRDVPLLLRLSGATETVTNAFSDAAVGWKNATELQDNYGIVVGTTAEKLKLLWNGLTELFATLGNGTTGPLSEFVTLLQNGINGLTDAFSTDIGQRVGLIVLAVTALLAVISFILGAAARAVAGVAALRTVINQLTIASGGATTAMGVTSGSMATLGITAGTASTGVRILWLAIKALAAATVVFALPQIADWATDSVNSMRGLSSELDDVIDRFTTPVDPNGFLGQQGLSQIAKNAPGVIAFARGLGDIVNTDVGDLQRIDEGIAAIAESGNFERANEKLAELKSSWIASGGSLEGFKAAFPDAIAALENMAQSSGYTKEQLAVLEEQSRLAAEATLALGESLGLSEEDFSNYQKSVQGAADGAINLSKAISTATKEGVFALEDFNTALTAQVTALENWEYNLQTLLARGVDFSVIQELVSLGPEAGSQLAQGLVDNFGTTLGQNSIDLIQRGIDMEQALSDGFIQNQALVMAASLKGEEAGLAMLQAISEGASEDKIAAIVAKYNIQIPTGLDTRSATEQLRSWLSAVNQGAYGIARVRVSGVNSSGGMTMASGGAVHGPGTGTSDSIPARLSNGEYVIRAAAVRKYGAGMFDQLNRGVAKFASGGPVGNGGGTNFPSSMVTEFGPQSMAAVRNSGGGVTVVLDDVAIARASNRGNAQLTGGNRR